MRHALSCEMLNRLDACRAQLLSKSAVVVAMKRRRKSMFLALRGLLSDPFLLFPLQDRTKSCTVNRVRGK